jgi:EAL domain-containing protein (putative c-di-GMP-specific phosphodiesterase class I)/PAS domain-containing protein
MAHTDIELERILYLMPVGVLTFAPDGTLILRNAAATQLLMPLLGEQALDNIYFALRHLCPELAAAVAAHKDPSGPIVDQRRIDAQIGPNRMTLSLSVTRVSGAACMAIVRDITRLTDMATFAFAGSDLLIDADGDWTIGWAGGAFGPLLDRAPRQVLGKPLSDLIAPRDREALAKTLAAGASGRLPPTVLRLANATQTRCVLAGLAIEGPNKRFFVTIGRLPEPAGATQTPLKPGKDFGIEVTNWVRGGQQAILGLLDVGDWGQTTAALDPFHRDILMREIGRLADEDTNGALVMGEVAAGRFGVLGPVGTDLARLGDALRDLVASFSPSGQAHVTGSQLDLDAGGLTLTESVQALRIVLSRFGTSGSDTSGLAGGLSGILEQANLHKRALSSIIDGGKFALMYQPVVALSDRAVHHYEALLRPEAGADNPASNPQEFVTMVEAVGLSVVLDRAVLRRALGAIAESGVSVAVNMSGLSIADPGFAEHLIGAASGVPPGRLLVELTETAEIDDLPAAAARIVRLRAAGAPVCLDDFGAGSASFRYLRDLRIDMVKIDGAYVQAAARSARGRAFVQSMRELATSTGAETIAEMVETEAEAALMLQLGVHYGQGWLFGRPAALAAAPLRKWRY